MQTYKRENKTEKNMIGNATEKKIKSNYYNIFTKETRIGF